jgi:hypothetical protein
MTRRIHREVREERLHLRGSKLVGVALAVKENEATHPINIGLLGANRVVAQAHGVAHAVEQPGGWGTRRLLFGRLRLRW